MKDEKRKLSEERKFMKKKFEEAKNWRQNIMEKQINKKNGRRWRRGEEKSLK